MTTGNPIYDKYAGVPAPSGTGWSGPDQAPWVVKHNEMRALAEAVVPFDRMVVPAEWARQFPEDSANWTP